MEKSISREFVPRCSQCLAILLPHLVYKLIKCKHTFHEHCISKYVRTSYIIVKEDGEIIRKRYNYFCPECNERMHPVDRKLLKNYINMDCYDIKRDQGFVENESSMSMGEYDGSDEEPEGKEKLNEFIARINWREKHGKR